MHKFTIGALALTLVACGGGSNTTYLRLVVAGTSAPKGMNCSNPTNGTTTVITNEGGLLDAAIYATPNNGYLLDLGAAASGPLAGALIPGTLTNGAYTFTSKIIDNTTSLVAEVDTTIAVTISGSSASGVVTIETKTTCQMNCGNQTNTDCTMSTPFAGSVIPGVEVLSSVGPSNGGTAIGH